MFDIQAFMIVTNVRDNRNHISSLRYYPFLIAASYCSLLVFTHDVKALGYVRQLGQPIGFSLTLRLLERINHAALKRS